MPIDRRSAVLHKKGQTMLSKHMRRTAMKTSSACTSIRDLSSTSSVSLLLEKLKQSERFLSAISIVMLNNTVFKKRTPLAFELSAA